MVVSDDDDAWPIAEGVRVIPRREAERLLLCQRTVREARRLARRIADDAVFAAEQARQAGYDAGHEAGYAQAQRVGLAEWMQRSEQAIAQLNAAHDDIERQRRAIVDVVSQALAMVLGPSISDEAWGRERIGCFVKQGLAALHRRTATVRLAVHPTQLAVVMSLRDAAPTSQPGFSIEADPLLPLDSYCIRGGEAGDEWWVSDSLPRALLALDGLWRATIE